MSFQWLSSHSDGCPVLTLSVATPAALPDQAFAALECLCCSATRSHRTRIS